jgi:hypothetical protein
MADPQLDIQIRPWAARSAAPVFDPASPFQVEGTAQAPDAAPAQPASQQAPQFDPSKPFDVAQPDQTASNAYNGIFSGGIPPELQGAYQAGRDRVSPPPPPPNPGANQPPAPASATDAPQQLAVDFQNQGSAAAQGTTPNVTAQQPNLISDKVFQNDAGELQYVDPATGQIVPSDQNKQVILRDPTDNALKVYARTGDTNEGMLSSLGRILMTGMASGAPTARAMLPISNVAAPSIDALKTAARAGFESPEVASLAIKPTALTGFAQKLGSTLNEAGLDENLAPKTFGVLKKAATLPEGNATVTGKNIVSLRRMLGNAASSTDPTERKAAASAMSELDKFAANIPKGEVISGDADAAAAKLNDARGNYSAAKPGELLDAKRVRAELRAAAANSGQNVSNTLRQRLADILTNPKERRGFSPSELKLMERIVKGTKTQNALRAGGNLLGGGGGMGAMVASGIGAYATGGPGAAIPLVGVAMKKLGDVLTINQINKLSEMVRSDSPLAKSIGNSMQDWSKAADMVKTPSGPNVARFVLASKNLMHNLSSAGISVRLPDFVRAVQGPTDSSAQQK